ncbi:hypothetical protein [Neorhizobium sp. SHOUNA12A]|uniref:hypothetical protein n=1 Tax=Neorhizobium sp. SHOUNA12A TaxID=2908923 RepID=UPI001FF42233|nr:hypothetical protein [Neorhizobium sp. SHOUNA12A]MCJ9672154.1 hypothetical protein [Neorhizobium sp. SHOUNA12B]
MSECKFIQSTAHTIGADVIGISQEGSTVFQIDDLGEAHLSYFGPLGKHILTEGNILLCDKGFKSFCNIDGKAEPKIVRVPDGAKFNPNEKNAMVLARACGGHPVTKTENDDPCNKFLTELMGVVGRVEDSCEIADTAHA